MSMSNTICRAFCPENKRRKQNFSNQSRLNQHLKNCRHNPENKNNYSNDQEVLDWYQKYKVQVSSEGSNRSISIHNNDPIEISPNIESSPGAVNIDNQQHTTELFDAMDCDTYRLWRLWR